VRKIVESDEVFRQRLAAGALPDLVDPIGRCWLERPAGWEAEISRLVAEAEADEAAVDAERRLAAPRSAARPPSRCAARARAEIVVLTATGRRSRRRRRGPAQRLVKLADEIESLRSELADTRLEARHARDRELAAVARLAAAETDRDDARRGAGTRRGRPRRGARRSRHARRGAVRARPARGHRRGARRAADGAGVAAGVRTPAPARRKALPLPGGVLGDGDAAGEYLLRSGASVLVDGYNVAKLAWPDLDLAGQRIVLLDAVENLAKRFGSDITVVFDGADVTGATADGRRVMRVVFSPDGVIADDVIRDEVRRLPVTRPVVVVTNDQAIVRDVRALGANTMSSDQLLSLMR
jgi:predicted RNA-binding protein with PIN domain